LAAISQGTRLSDLREAGVNIEQLIIKIEQQSGDVIMGNQQNNNVSGIQGSAFSFGTHSTNNVTNNFNNELADITKDLLATLNTVDIKPEDKQELVEIIDAASEEANSEKPKKRILKSLVGSANTFIDTATKTPGLITAYEKWSQFIQGIGS
jgi:hypothetical protein